MWSDAGGSGSGGVSFICGGPRGDGGVGEELENWGIGVLGRAFPSARRSLSLP